MFAVLLLALISPMPMTMTTARVTISYRTGWARNAVGCLPTMSQWALVQLHPFKNQETKLDLKLQLAVKESAALKPEDLDKLRTERLQYWTLRALQLEEERARWVTEAPPQLQRMLTSVHGCAHCSHDLYLASDLQKGLPFVGVLPRSPDFCKDWRRAGVRPLCG